MKVLVAQSCLTVIPWTVAHQASLSMGYSRQEYWSGLPFPLLGIFLTQGSNPNLLRLLHEQADSLPLSHLASPQYYDFSYYNKIFNFEF